VRYAWIDRQVGQYPLSSRCGCCRSGLPVAPNLLNREFTLVEPKQVFSSDIPCVWPDEGWLYLAAVLEPVCLHHSDQLLRTFDAFPTSRRCSRF